MDEDAEFAMIEASILVEEETLPRQPVPEAMPEKPILTTIDIVEPITSIHQEKPRDAE